MHGQAAKRPVTNSSNTWTPPEHGAVGVVDHGVDQAVLDDGHKLLQLLVVGQVVLRGNERQGRQTLVARCRQLLIRLFSFWSLAR